MISLGTSSDRIFSPEGTQSYYVTFAKSLHGVSAAPYFSVFYSEWKDEIIFPFGVNVALAEQWDFLPMNDGRHTHYLLTYKMENASVSAMLIKGRYPGVSYSFGLD